MRDSWKRYGSPYDPQYVGKQRRPQEVKPRDQLSCGDPNCNICNPHIETGDSMSSSYFNPSRDDFMVNSLRDAFIDARNDAISSTSYDRDYENARKKIKDYIISAPEQSFEDIKGNEEALQNLVDAIEAPTKHSELYKAYKLSMPKGALLYGPPGCGKTMFARAAASTMQRLYGSKFKEFISISGGSLQSPFVGVTERLIVDMFKFAKAHKNKHGIPMLIFIDEAEVLLPDRTGRVASWEKSQVATFLAEMDGIEESGAFVLLASNRPEVIDQAVLRDGRCDFKIKIERPNQEAIEHIIRDKFNGCFLGDSSIDDLVFTAVESLYDPHRVLQNALRISAVFDEKLVPHVKSSNYHFCLEHILSGAIASSIPIRASRNAFTRDKVNNTITGIKVEDVIKAVNDVFLENKDINHEFAFSEFKATIEKELENVGTVSNNDE